MDISVTSDSVTNDPKVSRIHLAKIYGYPLKRFGYGGKGVDELRESRKVNCSFLLHRIYVLKDNEPIHEKNWSKGFAQATSNVYPRRIRFIELRFTSKYVDFLHFIGFRYFALPSFRLADLLSEMVHDASILKNPGLEIRIAILERGRLTLACKKVN